MPDEIPSSPPPPPPLRPVFNPSSAASETVGEPAAATTTVTATGLTPNVAAGLAVLFPPISSIVFLVLEKQNLFVRFWAMQGVIFGAVWIIAGFALKVIAILFSPVPVLHLLVALFVGLASLVLSLAFIVVWILMLAKSFGGQEWEVPIIGKASRQQLAKMKF